MYDINNIIYESYNAIEKWKQLAKQAANKHLSPGIKDRKKREATECLETVIRFEIEEGSNRYSLTLVRKESAV